MHILFLSMYNSYFETSEEDFIFTCYCQFHSSYCQLFVCLQEVNFVTSCHPIISGCNELIISKLPEYTSKVSIWGEGNAELQWIALVNIEL